MADTKISALTPLSTVDSGDVIPIVDLSANETKKINRADFVTGASHLTLTDVGVNTHADLDTFISTTVPTTYAPITNPTFLGTVKLPKGVEIKDTTGDQSYILAVSSLTADRTVTLPLLTVDDEYVFAYHPSTLTNKRITKRVATITSHATPTINIGNYDCVTITAQAEAITNMTTNLSGSPTNFQSLLFRIKDNGTGRAITWGTSFVAMGVALPTTTTASKVLTVGFIYDTVTSKWGCVASLNEL